MIKLTLLGKAGKTFYLNPHIIEHIELVPDTTITLLSGRVIVVSEDYETITERIIDYRRKIGAFKNEE
ncbi:MAG: flagellar FlbD family protein [Spirochaetaceae bacterium]|nr:flagellar FlbD family protein [Spirochaetaceae bacterium]